jgi:hypothetical protein
VAGCCECGDEPSGSCATELVSSFVCKQFQITMKNTLTERRHIPNSRAAFLVRFPVLRCLATPSASAF